MTEPGGKPRWRLRLPDTMLGRTMLLIAALIAFGHYGWVTITERLEAPERARWAAHEAVSIVNLTRAALIASHPSRRLMLLAELSQSESIQLYSLEMLPEELDTPYTPFQARVVEALRSELGPQTLVGFDRIGIRGLWVSFELGADRYWLVIPRAPTGTEPGRSWAGWSALVLALSLLGAAIIVQRINRPLADLAAAAVRLTAGERPDRLDEDGPREIATVTRAFNRMTSHLERVENDRAMLLAGVSHDLRTPLTRLRLGIEMLPEHIDSASRRDMIGDIEDINAIIRQFLDFVRDESSELAIATDPAALLRTLAERYREAAGNIDVVADRQVPNDVLLRPLAMRRLLQNLIDNAIRYGNSPITLQTRIDDESLLLEVLDRGPGIPGDALERMMQPFTRMDMARGGGGTGLGLAIAERIARLHGGHIELQPREDGGLVARVRLPLRRAA